MYPWVRKDGDCLVPCGSGPLKSGCMCVSMCTHRHSTGFPESWLGGSSDPV